MNCRQLERPSLSCTTSQIIDICITESGCHCSTCYILSKLLHARKFPRWRFPLIFHHFPQITATNLIDLSAWGGNMWSSGRTWGFIQMLFLRIPGSACYTIKRMFLARRLSHLLRSSCSRTVQPRRIYIADSFLDRTAWSKRKRLWKVLISLISLWHSLYKQHICVGNSSVDLLTRFSTLKACQKHLLKPANGYLRISIFQTNCTCFLSLSDVPDS